MMMVVSTNISGSNFKLKKISRNKFKKKILGFGFR